MIKPLNGMILLLAQMLQIFLNLVDSLNLSCLPTTCSMTLAESSTFSICTWRSYFPECFLSVLRMKRIVSSSLFLTLANVAARGSPSLLHVTFGLGLPCMTRRETGVQTTMCQFMTNK